MARKMRDSGVEWIGEVPEGWEVNLIGTFYSQRSEKVSDRDYAPLSVTMKGVLPQLATVAKTDDGDNRKLVKKGDFAINSRSDRRGSCGISEYDGSVSLINTILMPRGEMDPRYYNWLFHTEAFADEFYKWGHGIVDDLWTTRWSEMKRIQIVAPPLPEQRAIADYLDGKCAAIDVAVDELKRGIEDCKAWKKAIIFEAVTGKASVSAAKNAKVAKRQMRDSGIPWIGEIPEGWEVMKGKYLFSARSGDAIRIEILADNGTYPVYGGGEVIGFADNWNCDAKTVLIGRVGARCGCVTLLRNRAWATDNALMISTNKCVRYITYLLIGANLNQFNSSNAQPLITAGKIKNLPFPFVCDLREQQAIADYLDEKCAAIDALVAEKEKLIVDLEAYKKSLIFELVTGKREVA